MVRYISEQQIVNDGSESGDSGLDGVRQFDLDGYEFCEDRSSDDLIVFDRSKDWKDKGKSEGKSRSGSAGTSMSKGKKRKGKKGSTRGGASKKSR